MLTRCLPDIAISRVIQFFALLAQHEPSFPVAKILIRLPVPQFSAELPPQVI